MTDKPVALVTGAARGIGYATAMRLVEDGFHVVVVDVSKRALEKMPVPEDARDSFESHQASVDDRDSVTALAADIKKRHGRIDALVNNAGLTRPGGLTTQTDDEWDLVVSVNLKGTFVCSSVVAEYMQEAGSGAIVNIGSVSAHGIRTGPPAYAAAKAGVEGLSRQMALELGPRGIRVNLVAPGSIVTEWLASNRTDEELEVIRQGVPLRRLGRPEDVASVVSFLLSDDARHVTGQIISVSGGQWLP
jgi:NAD(P)-dependent dehydrogenase (short-subunit alcohol dehydrogenase family)